MPGGSGTPSGDGESSGRATSSSVIAGDAVSANRNRESGHRRRRTRFGRIYESVGDVFAAHFGIDSRALAAFRISLGAILLVNLLLRARYLTAFHADAGVYPRSLLAEIDPMAATFSVFAQFGSTEAQAVLFVISGIVAVALVVGYRSSLAAVVSFVLLLSLNGRNPMILTGGDYLLGILLFWAVLLPIGERWSVDALRRDRPARERIVGLATAGLLLHVVVVYSVNAAHKHAGSTWGEGLGMQYLFQLDHMTLLLGDYVAEITPLLVALDYAWFWMVTLSFLLVVLRGWPRAVFASLFVAAHASMLATMHIGIFALVSIASLLVFYPPQVWNRIERHLARPVSGSLAGVRAAIATRGNPTTVPRPTGWERVVGGWRSIVVPLVAALAISSITVGNAALLESGDNDRWQMFAPNPPRAAVWTTVGGTTASGDHVDAFPFREANVTADRPPDMADTYPDVRWGTYSLSIDNRDEGLQTSLAEYVCRRWNATHADPLLNVTVKQHAELVRLNDANPIRRRTVIEYDCRTNSRGS